jgi:hypothetical protein
MTTVQRLVHLVFRYTAEKTESIRRNLLAIRIRAYVDELNIQARRAGCPDRRAWPGGLASFIVNELNALSTRDAHSITATYNYDLALAIIAHGQAHPRANRYSYAKALRSWEAARNTWKIPQIQQYTESSARGFAIRDFYNYNAELLRGSAIMLPTRAVCPICKGWIRRIADHGPVPLRVAAANPTPYHPNCPHTWITLPNRIAPSECPLLWMGREP